MVKEYFELFKNTPVIREAVIKSGKVKKNKKGEITKESVNAAIADITRSLESEVLVYSGDTNNNSIIRIVK